MKKLTSVELQVGERVWVPVSLNGSRAWMELNTGSAFTMIYPEAAKAFGLRLRPAPSDTQVLVHYDGQLLDKLAVLDSLQIGTVRLSKGTEFFVIPEGAAHHKGDPILGMPEGLNHYKGDPILGILAMDVFAHVDFELDLAHRTLRLFLQEHCAGNAAYWSDTAAAVPMYRDDLGELHFPMELNGERIDATMSTGQWDSSLRTDVTERVFHFDEHSPGNEVEGPSGEREVYYRAMKLTAPGLEVTNARIQLLAPVSSCRVLTIGQMVGYNTCGLRPLQLGLSVLEKLHLYFATGKQVLYFTAADSSEQPGAGTRAVPAAAPN